MAGDHSLLSGLVTCCLWMARMMASKFNNGIWLHWTWCYTTQYYYSYYYPQLPPRPPADVHPAVRLRGSVNNTEPAAAQLPTLQPVRPGGQTRVQVDLPRHRIQQRVGSLPLLPGYVFLCHPVSSLLVATDTVISPISYADSETSVVGLFSHCGVIEISCDYPKVTSIERWLYY